MSLPLVTIILPAYNSQNIISDTINSLLKQTLTDFELLVIDDASSDNTGDVVRGFTDTRIRYVRNGENLGIPTTMNKALSLARGQYLARCDHDDLARPTRLEKQISMFEADPTLHVCGAGMHLFGLMEADHLPYGEDSLIKAQLFCGMANILNPTATVRLSFVKERQLRFNPSLFAVDDYGFWVDCMAAGAKFANVLEILMDYRVHESNTSKLNPGLRERCCYRVLLQVIGMFFPDLTWREILVLSDLMWGPILTERKLAERIILVSQKAIQVQDTKFGQNRQKVVDIIHHYTILRLEAMHSNGDYTKTEYNNCLSTDFSIAKWLSAPT